MDIDGPPVSTPTGDVEASLLQQFNCLGTTDHEELISQMQQLMGVTYGTALFFLDMNHWNLQAAVCSYLDLNVEDPSSSTQNSLYSRTISPTSSDQYSVVPFQHSILTTSLCSSSKLSRKPLEGEDEMGGQSTVHGMGSGDVETGMGSIGPEPGMPEELMPTPGVPMWNGVDLRGSGGSNVWQGEDVTDTQMDADLSERMATLTASQVPSSCPQSPPDRPAC